MRETPAGEAGTVVTYLDTSVPEAEFRHGVVAGDGVSDPDTETIWVPIVRPGQSEGQSELTLVDPALIMSPGRHQEDPSGAIEVLAGSLAVLALDLHELDENDPLAARIGQNLLGRFVRAIRPVEDMLGMLVDAEPSGELALVLSCIGSAAAEFEDGHVDGGKMGILAASVAMAELIE
jgi:hypothetical protein